MEIRSKKQLEVVLSRLKGFKDAKVSAEQYITPSSIAAEVLWDLYIKGLLANKVSVDLGSGTGILGIGCLLLGCKKVYFVESEGSAMEICGQNLEKYQSEFKGRYELVLGDALDFKTKADIAIMNPPFGTKNRHIDRNFLKSAFSMANMTCSFHKTTTIDYIIEYARKNNRKLVERLDFRYLLGNTMKHHRKAKQYIGVSCVIFVISRR